MLTTVMNGARQSLGSADGLAETVGAPSLREKRRVGRRWWTMRRSDGTRRRRPPRSVSPGRWGACGGRPHGRVDGDRVSRAIGGVLRSTREEGPVCVSRPGDVAPVTINGAHRRPLARLRPRSWGVGRSRRGRPAGRDPALAPVRAARSGCRRRRTARHPAPPGSRRPAGTAPGPKRVRRPGRGLPRPRRRCPSRPGPPPRPRVTAAPAIAVRTPTTPGREPHRNRHHARGRTRRPQSARSPGNPRARHSTREHVTLADVLAG